VTDRDTFAAAALTGIIANEGEGPSLSNTCAYAYRIADAILCERAKNNADSIVPPRDKVSGVTSSPVSSGGSINRSAESQSPDAQRGEGEPLDVPQDDNSGAAGGRGRHIPDSRTRAIVSRLRRWCHAVDAESAQDLMDAAADEIERLRIRDYEREAIEAAAASVKRDDDSNGPILIELLKRTSQP